MKKFASSAIKIVAVIIFWISVWVLVSFHVNNEFLFPSPLSVLKTLSTLTRTKEFYITTSLSLGRVVFGIIISLFIGTILGYLTYTSKILNALFSPLLAAIKATPIASFIILALLWLDRSILPILITALIVVPIVWANVLEGIRSVDKDLIEVTYIYRFSLRKRMRLLYVPTVAPYFIAACKSALGMAWKAGIAAEILAVPDRSIGRELYFSRAYLETPTLFAWTLVVILLSVVIEYLLIRLLKVIGQRLHLMPKGDTNAKN